MNEFEGKTVIVTGATGLIGSNLVYKLLQNDSIKVIAVGRNKKKLEVVFSQYLDDKRLILEECDVSLPIEWNDDINYIFHAASPIAGNIIRETPIDVILPNIVGTLNILNFIEKQREEKGINAKLIIFSSATVYSNIEKQDIVVNEGETSIADALDAQNAPYSESKRMIEVIARSFVKQKKMDISIVRFSYVYGYTKSSPNTAFYQFIKTALSGQNIVLNNKGLPRRDNIYIDDAVNGLLYVAKNGESGEAYNISTNTEKNNFAAIDEMAFIIASVVNEKKKTDIKVEYKDSSAEYSRLPGVVLNNDKLHSLGWEVKIGLEEGISRTINQFMKELGM